MRCVVFCRVRKMKERYAQSQMRKQANRMTFGEVYTMCVVYALVMWCIPPSSDRGGCVPGRPRLHRGAAGEGGRGRAHQGTSRRQKDTSLHLQKTAGFHITSYTLHAHNSSLEGAMKLKFASFCSPLRCPFKLWYPPCRDRCSGRRCTGARRL